MPMPWSVDPHHHLAGAGRRVDGDPPAAIGILRGVAEDVGEHLRQPHRIAVERHRRRRQRHRHRLPGARRVSAGWSRAAASSTSCRTTGSRRSSRRPRVIRETSSRSSSSRAMWRAWRSITVGGRAVTGVVGAAQLAAARRCCGSAPADCAARGRARPGSRPCGGRPRAATPSSALRAPMSRTIDDAPTMRPVSSRIGDSVTETSNTVPSRATRSVSKDGDALALTDPPQQLGFLVAPVDRHHARDAAADDLGGGVAEHPLGAGVPRQDAAVQALGEDGVLGRLDHRGQERLRAIGHPALAGDPCSASARARASAARMWCCCSICRRARCSCSLAALMRTPISTNSTRPMTLPGLLQGQREGRLEEPVVGRRCAQQRGQQARPPSPYQAATMISAEEGDEGQLEAQPPRQQARAAPRRSRRPPADTPRSGAPTSCGQL